MSNDTNYSLIFRHAKRKYLEQVVQYLETKKARWDEAQEQGKSCDDIMTELGLSSPAEVVSWGFQFGSIENDPDSKGFMMTAESFANENSSNLAIGGDGGELQELMGKFPELDIGGTYSDEYAAGSVVGCDKYEERTRAEETARIAEWGENGDAEYNEETKEMLLKAFTGELSVKEAKKLIAQGADVNGVINYTPFAQMLDSGGGGLLEAIPEFIDKGMKIETLTNINERAAEKIIAIEGWHIDLSSLLNLDVKTAKVLINGLNTREKPPHLSLGLYQLESGIIDIISGYSGGMTLNHLASLSVDEAKALANINGDLLHLDGLTELTSKVACAIAKFRGILFFNSLAELSVKAALELANHAGDLFLDGLTDISGEVASALSRHRGQLFLRGLTELSDQVAEALAGHKGGMIFDGVAEMSDKIIELLARSEGGLDLNGLTELSNKAAKALGKHNGGIFLEGLTTISDAAAEELGNNAGYSLSLPGLTEISDNVAKGLAKYKGPELSLGGVTNISDKAIEALASYKGTLFIDGLNALSDKAAEALATHEGEICLGSPIISQRAAQILQRHGSINSGLDLDAIAKGES